MDNNNKQSEAKEESNKHHKSRESLVSGGDPKRKLESPGRHQ